MTAKLKKFITGIVLLAVIVAAWLFLRPILDIGRSIRNDSRVSNKGNLSSVRSALQIYYGDNEGRFPTDDLSCLTKDNKYLPELPPLWVKYDRDHPHPQTNEVVVYSSGSGGDTGKYAYMNDPAYPAQWGNLFVDCTHPDNGKMPWSTF